MAITAVIAGAAGQDGCCLSRLLLEKGCRVVGVTRRPAAELESGVEPRTADLLDLSSLISLLEEAEPSEVYNLAGLSHIPSCWAAPALAGQLNGLAAVRFLEAIRRVNPKIRFFQASSSRMYAGRGGEVDEETPFCPSDPYGVSKVFSHCAVRAYRDAYGLFAGSGILFNHESPRRGVEFVTRKITVAAARIACGLQSQLLLGDLGAARDWGYAGDYVEAMWRMLQSDEPADYVIGTGRLRTVGQFAESAFQRLGLDWKEHVSSHPALMRTEPAPPVVANPRKAESNLGWRPKTSFQRLVEMMADADLAAAKIEAGDRWEGTAGRTRVDPED